MEASYPIELLAIFDLYLLDLPAPTELPKATTDLATELGLEALDMVSAVLTAVIGLGGLPIGVI